eukprot:gene9286-11382_t
MSKNKTAVSTAAVSKKNNNNSKVAAAVSKTNNKSDNNNNDSNHKPVNLFPSYDSKKRKHDPSDKTKLEKKTKKDKREEKIEKKSKIDHLYPIVRESKLLWVKIKEKKLSKEERSQLIDQLFTKLKGHILNVVVKHDASRVVQSMLKYGNEQQKELIFSELKGHELELSKSQYGKFLILKQLKYGTKEHQERIIKSFYGKFVNLITHKESSQVVEYMYSEVADRVQKTAIIEEFYGPEYRLFKSDKPRTLEQLLEAHPNKKESIITFLSKQLTKLLSSKGDRVVQLTIIQHLLIDFFKYSSPDDCADMAETLSEILVPMIHTKEGSLACYYAISYGSPKTRKTIVKTLKGFLPKIASEDNSYLALIRLLDVVDDTLLLTKSVIAELLPNLPELAVSKQGHLWIMHILCPYTPQNFTQQTISLLTPVMKNLNGEERQISKKEQSTRRKELLEFISPKLIELCSSQTYELLTNQYGIKVLCQTLKHADGNKILLMKKILDLMTKEMFEENAQNIQILLKSDFIKSDKFDWLELCLSGENKNSVFIFRDLIKSLPDGEKKTGAINSIVKSKKKLEATKIPGVSTLLNLCPPEEKPKPTEKTAKSTKTTTTTNAAATKPTATTSKSTTATATKKVVSKK